MSRTALARPGRDTWVVLLAGLGVFFAADDQTSVVAVLPKMIDDVGLAQDQFYRAAWIVNGYILGYVVAMPLMGRVADLFGRGRVLRAGAGALRRRLGLGGGVAGPDAAVDGARRAGGWGRRRRAGLDGDGGGVGSAGATRPRARRDRGRIGGGRFDRAAMGWRPRRPDRLARRLLAERAALPTDRAGGLAPGADARRGRSRAARPAWRAADWCEPGLPDGRSDRGIRSSRGRRA